MPPLAHIVEQDTVFPGYDIPVDMTTFPVFLLDVDLDGRQDLLSYHPTRKGSVSIHITSLTTEMYLLMILCLQFQEDSLLCQIWLM